VTDQPGRHRIEYLAQHEPAGRGDGDDRFLVIRRPPFRQKLQRRSLDIEPLAVASVAAADRFVDEAAVGIQRVEVARAAQQQRLPRPA